MLDVTGMEITDRPLVAFVVTVGVASAVYTGFQLVFDGRVNVLETATFAVVFAVILVGLAWLRDRYLG